LNSKGPHHKFSITSAQSKNYKNRRRRIPIAVEYLSIEIVAGEDADLDVVLHNRGKKDESVSLNVTYIPEG
jgi:uncharacterized membrane protein